MAGSNGSIDKQYRINHSPDNPDNVTPGGHFDERIPFRYAVSELLRARVPAVHVPDNLPLFIIYKHGEGVPTLDLAEPAAFRMLQVLQGLAVVNLPVSAVNVKDVLAIAVDAFLVPPVGRNQAEADHAVEGLFYLDLEIVDAAFGDWLLAVDHEFFVSALPDLKGLPVGHAVEMLSQVVYLFIGLKCKGVGVFLEDVHAPLLLHQLIHMQIDDLLLDLFV